MLPLGRLAWNPTDVVAAPGANVPLNPTLRNVTFCPLTVATVFHDPVSTCPAGNVNVTVQPVMVDDPVFVIVNG